MIYEKNEKVRSSTKFKDGTYLCVDYIIESEDNEFTRYYRIDNTTEDKVLDLVSLIKRIWSFPWEEQIIVIKETQNIYMHINETFDNHPVAMYLRIVKDGVEYSGKMVNDDEIVLPLLLENPE